MPALMSFFGVVFCSSHVKRDHVFTIFFTGKLPTLFSFHNISLTLSLVANQFRSQFVAVFYFDSGQANALFCYYRYYSKRKKF